MLPSGVVVALVYLGLPVSCPILNVNLTTCSDDWVTLGNDRPILASSPPGNGHATQVVYLTNLQKDAFDMCK